MAGKSRRSYKGAAVSNTIASGGLAANATSITVTDNMSTGGWPTTSEPFFCVIEPGTSREEKVCVIYANTTTLTVVDPSAVSGWSSNVAGRGVDNTTDREHASGSVIYPVFTAIEANQANELVSKYQGQGALVYQGASTFQELTLGTAGQVLVVNSGATGPQWRNVVDVALQGPQGTQGPQGAQGAQGATGPQGAQGATGATGSQGATGPQGATGATGSTGAQGPQGAQGATGPVNTDTEANGNTAALRTSGGQIKATTFLATDTGSTTPFAQSGTFTYIGLNCGRVDNTDTIYNDVIAGGRTVLVGSSASTLGTSASSRRFKTNIVPAVLNVEDIYNLQPVTFDYNELVKAETEEQRFNHFGLIAEDVAETSLSFLVDNDSQGLPRHIHYEMLAVALVEALKQQNQRIIDLETRITALESN